MHYGWVRVKTKWWKLKKKQKKEQKRIGSWREKPKAFLRSFELKLPNSWLNKIHTWNWTVLIAELGYKYDFQWVLNLKPFHSKFKKKIFLNNIVAVTDDLVYCYLIFYKEKQAQNQHEKNIRSFTELWQSTAWKKYGRKSSLASVLIEISTKDLFGS